MYSIDSHGHLQVLVWNLHKQTGRDWRNELSQYSLHSQIVLLQEVKLTMAFKRYIKEAHWHANHVDAFTIFNNSAGVLSAGKSPVESVSGYRIPEPVFRLPKSSSIARYQLSNGQILTAVNVHLINFTLGMKAYRKQMSTLITDLRDDNGPMIFAGDFNTWSRKRQEMIALMMMDLGLSEVTYANDMRRHFLNRLPLDHVYYRGLDLKKAEVLTTTASDHNPIRVTFHIDNHFRSLH
ncbi:endonuclease/exonuclease/phosphatase family protein [Vibrio salinus]|uniref:endonuclease/exonuclease/phosphatase family protein n=1 Tax=Vibrio salinus TaxID=2899784 RepID=UPI001E3F6721|nr:endonuclease/exonuclease/phosphatase family protein [Vibrio salinus]MCE0493715.1 endonuclease/exonuclease/phosphatase family protein [Vibrio salinus]